MELHMDVNGIWSITFHLSDPIICFTLISNIYDILLLAPSHIHYQDEADLRLKRALFISATPKNYGLEI